RGRCGPTTCCELHFAIDCDFRRATTERSSGSADDHRMVTARAHLRASGWLPFDPMSARSAIRRTRDAEPARLSLRSLAKGGVGVRASVRYASNQLIALAVSPRLSQSAVSGYTASAVPCSSYV